MSTHASNITKAAFPALLNALFDRSLLPEHLVSGFRATGLHPLSRSAIKDEKLEASATFHPEQHHRRVVEQSQLISPVTHRVATYFTQFFVEKTSKARHQTGGRLRPKYYGEALTEDEAFDRLRKQKEEREAKKQSRKRQGKGSKKVQGEPTTQCHKISDDVCQGCGDSYEDDDADAKQFWVGCDQCSRWYHYWCANLLQMPEPEEPFLCPECSG